MSIVLLCLFFTLSAHAYNISSQDPIDPTFQPYVESFVADSKGDITLDDFKHIEIQFKDLSKVKVEDPNAHAIGLCTWGWQLVGKHNRINFDPVYWQYASEIQRWSTVYHEFGHCLLNRQHTSTAPANLFLLWLQSVHVNVDMHVKNPYLRDGCPSSLMHPSEFSSACLYGHRAHYIEELFAKAHPTPLEFYEDFGGAGDASDLSVKNPFGRFFSDRQQ